MKEDMHNAGIRNDRYMTPREVEIAAANYRAVQRSVETGIDPNSKFERFRRFISRIGIVLVLLYYAVLLIMTLVESL